MKTFSALAMVTMLTLGVASPAFAQPAASAMVTSDNGLRTSKLIGAHVFNQQGDDFGTIDDIVVSPKGGEPIAVLSVGGFLGIGSKLVAVRSVMSGWKATR